MDSSCAPDSSPLKQSEIERLLSKKKLFEGKKPNLDAPIRAVG